MTEQQDPLEQLLDLLVYAPLGLALSARDIVPTLAEKGRRHYGPQATAARLVGKLAARQGRREVEHLVANARRQAEQLLGDLFPAARPDAAGSPAGEGSNGSGPQPAPPPEPEGPAPGPTAPTRVAAADPPAVAGVPSPAPAPSGPDVSELAIPGYDTLSASQVVQRLEGLTPGELEAVRVYEQARRGRKTVLNRIGQLKDSA